MGHAFVTSLDEPHCQQCGCKYHCVRCNEGTGVMGHWNERIQGYTCQQPPPPPTPPIAPPPARIYDYPIGTKLKSNFGPADRENPNHSEVIGYTPKGRVLLSRIEIDHEYVAELDTLNRSYIIISRPSQGSLPLV